MQEGCNAIRGIQQKKDPISSNRYTFEIYGAAFPIGSKNRPIYALRRSAEISRLVAPGNFVNFAEAALLLC